MIDFIIGLFASHAKPTAQATADAAHDAAVFSDNQRLVVILLGFGFIIGGLMLNKTLRQSIAKNFKTTVKAVS